MYFFYPTGPSSTMWHATRSDQNMQNSGLRLSDTVCTAPLGPIPEAPAPCLWDSFDTMEWENTRKKLVKNTKESENLWMQNISNTFINFWILKEFLSPNWNNVWDCCGLDASLGQISWCHMCIWHQVMNMTSIYGIGQFVRSLCSKKPLDQGNCTCGSDFG